MKKILFLLLTIFTLQASTPNFDFLKNAGAHAGIGALLLATSLYSTGETMLDCGHKYYELKKEYCRYLLELEGLDEYKVMSPQEKKFWAVNQALSKIPKVFWREIIAGTFSAATGYLGLKYLAKSLSDLA